MASCPTSTAAFVLVLLHLAVYGSADNGASLEILPSGDLQSKPIGSSIMLTCKPNVSGPNIISDMKWLDPLDRVIEPRDLLVLPIDSDNPATVNPDMYTEMHQDNSISLFFNSLKEEQAGRYTCLASYASLEALNKTVMIETIDAITWINAPENQFPILNKEFKIKCHVSARPSPSVDWLHDGKRITTNDHYIIETHALKIKKVEESDEGVYTCRASVPTTGELKERAIRVEVHEEPKIEEIRSEIEIVEGKTETITCKASGKPRPTYTWVKSLTKENLATKDRFGVEEDTGVLTITNVNREDAGEYECTAKNAAGTANTNIIVDVIGKPKIMEFLNRTSVAGKNMEIVCKAFGRPVPQVTFRKHTSVNPYVMGIQPDDDRIVLSSMIDNAKSETVAVLSIQNILRDDDGLYECVATNKVAAAYKNGHLTVEFPPSFASMNNHTVWSWEQRPVNLTCIAESIPNATIRWTMNGDRPVDLSDPMYKQLGNGPISTLVVTPVDRRYYSNYRCHATNTHGHREHLIELKEAEKPGMLQQATMSEITATTITFNLVLPPSQPELPLQSVTVQYKEVNQAWANAKNKTWSIGSPYILEGLKPQTSYEFRFLARNEVGNGNWGANFAENTPMRTFPNAPKVQMRLQDSVYDTSPFNNQYELHWLTPADNGEPIDMYEIRYCQIKRAGTDWEVFENTCRTIESKGQRSKEWLKDLNSDTFYRAEIRAHNAIGFSSPTLLHFKTASGGNMPLVHKGPLISSAAIIGIVIAALFLIIVVIDVICCCTHKTGIIYYVCERSRKKPVDEEDAKLGREEKEPLKEEKKIAPIIDSGLRRETSITFDGKRSVSKTGFVGKDSAV